MQDTPELGGVGPTTQHKTCIKPTAAVAFNNTADQKGAETLAQPNPDPDWAGAVLSAADGASFTEDMPTSCDGNPSPMEDSGHNEDIPEDAAPTQTPEKPQLAQECPAPVYMAKVSKGAAAIHMSCAQAAQHSPERTMHDLYTTGAPDAPDAPRKQPKAARKPKSGSMRKSIKEAKYLKPWNMQGCIRNEVASEFAVLLHVKYFVTGTHHLRRLYKTSRAAWGTTVSPWLKRLLHRINIFSIFLEVLVQRIPSPRLSISQSEATIIIEPPVTSLRC